MDEIAGYVSVTTSSLAPKDFPIKNGDSIAVKVNGVTKLTGFVDQTGANGSSNTHTITIAGRDNTQDLIDSTVPDSEQAKEGEQTLTTMCTSMITALGCDMAVIDSSGTDLTFPANELESAESGDTCFEFLQSYARKKQVYLVPSGLGDLVIFRPTQTVRSSPLLHEISGNNNNIERWSTNVSSQNLFNKYECKSQDNFGYDSNSSYKGEGTAYKGTALDETIRPQRQLQFTAEQHMASLTVQERANEESNIRQARSKTYSCTVKGHGQSNDEPWDIGFVTFVKDDYADIQGEFVIRNVSFEESANGLYTNITLAQLDAYKVQAVPDTDNARKSNQGELLTRPTPQTSKVIR